MRAPLIILIEAPALALGVVSGDTIERKLTALQDKPSKIVSAGVTTGN